VEILTSELVTVTVKETVRVWELSWLRCQ